jgi:hypothetical protein
MVQLDLRLDEAQLLACQLARQYLAVANADQDLSHRVGKRRWHARNNVGADVDADSGGTAERLRFSAITS